MTYNVAHSGAPWFEHLTDSVRALGEAAFEWQLADRAAALADDQLQMGRSVPHEGRTADRVGPDTLPVHRRIRIRRPHVQAVRELTLIHMEHRNRTRFEYGRAAMLFASGAAWAIARVQAGQQPDKVEFDLDEYERPAPVPHLYGVGGLDGYAHADKVRAAYERLLSMEHAARTAEEIAGRDDHEVTERDANDMFEAADAARGIQDAAYAYGLLVERALGHVLRGPKDAHRKQRAGQRAAEEKAEFEGYQDHDDRPWATEEDADTEDGDE